MKRIVTIAVGTAVALLLGGCQSNVQEHHVDQVRAGMTREEVQAVMGVPEAAAYAPGQDCGTYTVTKSFWRRVPWSLTERYTVCYVDNRVDHFVRQGERDS
jgi:hypothetical protein